MAEAASESVNQGPGNDSVKAHVKSRGTWLRGVFMVLFVVIFNIAEFVLMMTALFQFLATLFTGEPNQRAVRFGANLSEFIRQIGRYLTFGSDERPFPFADWPKGARVSRKQATTTS
ncbi:MAG TPA: DUF4389 domain-containing protein [Alphaproteobacteria bacterium]|nr:DUF4389 domain-containing protein [Alphaproteobacteria bacterium]